jgi:RHS repeat-associated protein
MLTYWRKIECARFSTYSPFGATSYIWNSPSATMDLRFPGQWFQLESGLAYNWHRHYDPTIGRYIEPDPIGLQGGRNLYGYATQNPLAYADPDGRNPMLVIGAACAEFPQACISIGAGTAWLITEMVVRPSGMDRLMERAWDRYCSSKGDDPCSNLKNTLNTAITQAEGKMEAMLADRKVLFGTVGWTTHADDLSGRIANIKAMIRLAKAIQCDVSAEEARATDLVIPTAPRGKP